MKSKPYFAAPPSAPALPAAPASPSAFTVTSQSANRLLAWTANGARARFVDIQRSIDGAAFADLAVVNLTHENTLSYLDEAPSGTTQVYRIRSRNTGGVSVWLSSWTPASESNLAAWYRADVGVAATGGVVDTWADQSGNARTLANSANRPAVVADGVTTGFPSIEFDGTNDTLKTGSFTMDQPLTIYSLHKHRTYVASARVYQGLTDGFVYASTPSPNIAMRTGGSVGPVIAPLIDAWTVFTGVWNGATSVGQIKHQLPQGGNPGAGNFGGLALAATAVPGNFGAVSFGEVVVRAVVDNAITKHRHVAWMMRRAGIAYHNMICEGDSLTAGAGVAEGSLWPIKFLQLKGLTTTPWGYRIQATGGEDVADLNVRATTTDMFLDETPRNLLTVWVGTNNLVAGSTPQQTLTLLAAYCRARRAMGWQIAVFTTLPRNAGTNFENNRQEYNQLIRDNWRLWADYLVDIGADSTIGQYGQQDNLTYYIVGGTHLTAAGHQIVADLLNTVIS